MATELSNTDRAIISTLQRDGKATNSTIATEAGVSEETTRGRTHRLVQEGVIKIIAVPDAVKLGFSCEAIIRIEAKPGRAYDVVSRLESPDEAHMVTSTTGSYDVFAMVTLRSHDELLDFITKRVSVISGVARTETFICLGTKK